MGALYAESAASPTSVRSFNAASPRSTRQTEPASPGFARGASSELLGQSMGRTKSDAKSEAKMKASWRVDGTPMEVASPRMTTLTNVGSPRSAWGLPRDAPSELNGQALASEMGPAMTTVSSKVTWLTDYSSAKRNDTRDVMSLTWENWNTNDPRSQGEGRQRGSVTSSAARTFTSSRSTTLGCGDDSDTPRRAPSLRASQTTSALPVQATRGKSVAGRKSVAGSFHARKRETLPDLKHHTEQLGRETNVESLSVRRTGPRLVEDIRIEDM